MPPSRDAPLPPLPAPSRPDLRGVVREGAENRPGIYRFLGPRGEVLYVGKSVRVRARLLSYFRASRGKALEIVRVAQGVEWEYVPTEFEALLREFRQIRAFRPRYNVRHRRERRFAWIKVTREEAPRLIATRRPVADGARYFGPFPATRALPGTVRDLAHLLGLRDCAARTPMHFSDQLDLLAPPRAPLCPRAELGNCLAPCAAFTSRDGYRSQVEDAAAFLGGESDDILIRVETRIRSASRRHAFEVAARWRDRRDRFASLQDAIVETGKSLDALRFVYRVPTPGAAASARGYLVVGGRVRLTFDEPAVAGDAATPLSATPEARQLWKRIRIALARAEREPPTPLDEEAREELFLVARWFRNHPDEFERTAPPEGYLPPVGT